MNQYFTYAFIAFIILCLISSIQSMIGQDSEHNPTPIGKIGGVIASIVSCASSALCAYGVIAGE